MKRHDVSNPGPESTEPFAWAVTNKLLDGKPRQLMAYSTRQLAEDVAAALDPSLQVVPLYATPPDTAPAWRPIETAPKNAGHLLGLVDGEARFIAWGKTSHVPIYGWNLADQGAEDFDLCKPTHWMPIPPPPGESAPTVDHTAVMRQAPIGRALAMRVLQSDLYRHLDDTERAECDALIHDHLATLRGALPGGV